MKPDTGIGQDNYLRCDIAKDCFDTYPESVHSVRAAAEAAAVASIHSAG